MIPGDTLQSNNEAPPSGVWGGQARTIGQIFNWEQAPAAVPGQSRPADWRAVALAVLVLWAIFKRKRA